MLQNTLILRGVNFDLVYGNVKESQSNATVFFLFQMEFIKIPQLVLIRMRFLDQIEILLFLSVFFFLMKCFQRFIMNHVFR